MKKLLPLTLILIIFPSIIYANFGQVIMLKGKATKLVPKSHSAQNINMNDRLPEDTSIVTSDSSVVKVKLQNHTIMTIGPNSKIVLTEIPRSEQNVIKMFGGQLRSQVEKTLGKKSENRLIIKTPTAAMGVRGTDFSIVFNPENKVTSLVTIDGNVAMAKIDEHKLINEKTGKISTNSDLLDKTLKDEKEVVQVVEGRYAGLLPEHDKITLPVKIAPEQIKALQETTEIKKDEVNYEALKEELHIKEAPPEGVNNVKTDEFAMKSGGFIDFKTGLYVPPPENAKFDQESKTYKMPETFGKVDEKTGDYKAPEGFTLTATEGFVAVNPSDEGKKDLEKILNKEIAKEIVVAENKNEESEFWQDIFGEKEEKNILKKNFQSKVSLISGYDTNVILPLYYESFYVSNEHSGFIKTSGELHKTFQLKNDYALTPRVDFDGQFYTRSKNWPSYQSTYIDGKISMALSKTHQLSDKNAKFIIAPGYFHQDRLSRDAKKSFSPYVKDINILLGEKIHLNQAESLFISLELRKYHDYRNIDDGLMKVFRLDHDYNYSTSLKQKSYFSFIDKNADHWNYQGNFSYFGTGIYHKTWEDFTLGSSIELKQTKRSGFQDIRGEEKQLMLNPNITYQITDEINTFLDYSFTKQNSKEKLNYDFSKHLVMLGISGQF